MNNQVLQGQVVQSSGIVYFEFPSVLPYTKKKALKMLAVIINVFLYKRTKKLIV